jgi:DNA-binding GntR family transcriptional regulator
MEHLTPPATLLEQVYASILEAICDGRLAPGERLTQDEVAERLNVSRQPVGQALLVLRTQNFVTDAGRRGMIVAPLDPEFIRSVYQFRKAIDPLAAGLAAERVAPEAIKRGKRILEAGQKALAAGSVPRLIVADMDFHMLIYGLSGNQLVVDSMGTYWNHLRRAMREVLERESYRANVLGEHADILRAIASGDATEAERASRNHIEQAASFLERKVAEAALDERRKRKR